LDDKISIILLEREKENMGLSKISRGGVNFSKQ
jgi:hypothetical protein